MEERKCLHCSDYWGCSDNEKSKCPACTIIPQYNCWSFETSFKPKKKREFDYCLMCPWFQLHHPS
ncbi:MAG: hypothetical protein JW867_08360 [Candidatus Omnitrophica bacterium]|nr:hypothetical protein [Candidatus Omnitrophota bacterium]